MHRVFQISIFLACLYGIVTFAVFSRDAFPEFITTQYYKERYYKEVDWNLSRQHKIKIMEKYNAFINRYGMPTTTSEYLEILRLLFRLTPLESFERWNKVDEGWEYSWNYNYRHWNNPLVLTFWNFQENYDTVNIESIENVTPYFYTKRTRQIIKRSTPTSFKTGVFSTYLLGFLSITVFLLWTVRIRKYTPEEKHLKKNMKNLKNQILEIEERNLLSEKEIKQFNDKERGELIKRFIDRFFNDKKRPLEYKLERLFSLKEDKTISEEEFKEAKKQLIEQGA